MIEKALMKFRIRDEINAEEEAALHGLVSEVVEYPAGFTFVRSGEELGYSTILLDGLVARYKDLSDGQRQITHVHVPGDYADLHSFTLKHLDHAVMTLSPCRIAKTPHDRIHKITQTLPHLTRLLWFSTTLDASIHREWVVSLGRRSAIERAAHFLCELQVRLKMVGLGNEISFPLPINQTELSECLGLTSVHVNRVLRELREAGLAEFKGGVVTIGDLAGLQALGEFDPAYLYLEKRDS